MGVFDALKKRDVPSELPPLSFDELARNLEKDLNASNRNEMASPALPLKDGGVYKALPVNAAARQDIPVIKQGLSESDDQGYFKDVLKTVTDKLREGSALDGWYKNTVADFDIVDRMKDYWETQRPELFIKGAGAVHTQLLEKTEALHGLEKEWQELYFALRVKEEAIRQQEKELKESLGQFIEIYKRSMSKGKTKA